MDPQRNHRLRHQSHRCDSEQNLATAGRQTVAPPQWGRRRPWHRKLAGRVAATGFAKAKRRGCQLAQRLPRLEWLNCSVDSLGPTPALAASRRARALRTVHAETMPTSAAPMGYKAKNPYPPKCRIRDPPQSRHLRWVAEYSARFQGLDCQWSLRYSAHSFVGQLE